MISLTRFDNADDLFYSALDIALTGELARPRNIAVHEARGVTMVLEDPTRNVVTHQTRKANYHFMVAEWLWVLFGLSDVETIAGYNKQIAAFSDDGASFFGAYGPRIQRDLMAIEQLLIRDPDTRQAVLCTWRPEALHQRTKDVPCTLTWQFFLRRNRLELHVNMRSNDVWLGLPYDLYNFTQVQRYLADRLGVKPGAYYHHVGSLHLYETNVTDAENVLHNAWLVRDVGASPPPAPNLESNLREILERLPRRLDPGAAREMAAQLDPRSRSFAGVLINRFSKDRADLDAFWQRLVP